MTQRYTRTGTGVHWQQPCTSAHRQEEEVVVEEESLFKADTVNEEDQVLRLRVFLCFM